jgi:hypothetical protein
MFVYMAMGTDNTEFGVATNHREIIRCDWSPMSTNFIILIKTCIKTGSGTRDGFGDLVMCGEGVRHPTASVRRRLPPSMCTCVCLINQAKKSWIIIKAYMASCLSIFHDSNNCTIYWTNGQTKWHVRMSGPNMRLGL